jgi:hypothetical protein
MHGYQSQTERSSSNLLPETFKSGHRDHQTGNGRQTDRNSQEDLYNSRSVQEPDPDRQRPSSRRHGIQKKLKSNLKGALSETLQDNLKKKVKASKGYQKLLTKKKLLTKNVLNKSPKLANIAKFLSKG